VILAQFASVSSAENLSGVDDERALGSQFVQFGGQLYQRARVIRLMRYYFQSQMCMFQWRHSGLVNFLNRTATGYQVRVEGPWIG